VRLALYQPEIPQNTGTLMRLCACLDIGLDVIHPCGFLWEDRHLRRAGMDYQDKAVITHHESWEVFSRWSRKESRRVILLDTKARTAYTDFSFQSNDILLLGQESSGVPSEVFYDIINRLKIPMISNCRSINVALVAAMVMGEGLRQLNAFPETGI
jgi:tRNA (cytidine/uridine-2'-O-)-methyltransferase